MYESRSLRPGSLWLYAKPQPSGDMLRLLAIPFASFVKSLLFLARYMPEGVSFSRDPAFELTTIPRIESSNDLSPVRGADQGPVPTFIRRTRPLD